MTAEQQARDMLERMEWERAQELSAGDIVELANLIANFDALRVCLRGLVQELTNIEDSKKLIPHLVTNAEWLLNR